MKLRSLQGPGGGFYSRRTDIAVYVALFLVTYVVVVMPSKFKQPDASIWNAKLLISGTLLGALATFAMMVVVHDRRLRSWSVKKILLVLPYLFFTAGIGVAIGLQYLHSGPLATPKIVGWKPNWLFSVSVLSAYSVLWFAIRAKVRTAVARRLKRRRLQNGPAYSRSSRPAK